MINPKWLTRNVYSEEAEPPLQNFPKLHICSNKHNDWIDFLECRNICLILCNIKEMIYNEIYQEIGEKTRICEDVFPARTCFQDVCSFKTKRS